jgi:radical SAM protein with 4Fe4S-binding SPASM domain
VGKHLDSLSIDHNVENVLLRYDIGEAVWEKIPCYIGWIWSRVKPDGTVVPCNTCDLVMGDLKEKRFRDIWNDSAYRAFRRKAMTREGLESMSEYCDCGFCCNVWDSARVHKFFKWFSPFRLNKTGRK